MSYLIKDIKKPAEHMKLHLRFSELRSQFTKFQNDQVTDPKCPKLGGKALNLKNDFSKLKTQLYQIVDFGDSVTDEERRRCLLVAHEVYSYIRQLHDGV